MPKLTVQNDNITVETSAAVSILNTLIRESIAIDHRCGGRAQCGTCRIRIVSGFESTSPVNERERAKLDKFKRNENLRLACQTYISGDVTIDIVSRTGGSF